MAEKYYVAPGKSISIKRGIAGAGELVSAKDLHDPIPKKDMAALSLEEQKKYKEKAFQELVKSSKGLLVKVKPAEPTEAIEVNLRSENVDQIVDLSGETEKKPTSKTIGGGAKKK